MQLGGLAGMTALTMGLGQDGVKAAELKKQATMETPPVRESLNGVKTEPLQP
jgi:hypothetical protein